VEDIIDQGEQRGSKKSENKGGRSTITEQGGCAQRSNPTEKILKASGPGLRKDKGPEAG